MNKENYLSEQKTLEQIVTEIREKQDILKKKYIEANKKFELEERILIKTPAYKRTTPDNLGRKYIPEQTKYAYVEGYRVDRDGEITYLLARETRAGKKAIAKTSYNEYDTLEKITL